MVRVQFSNFYLKRRRGIPRYRFPDFPTGYSQVAKSGKHVQSGRADLIVHDNMTGRKRRRVPPKGQLPYKPKFRDFFQEWNRNKAQNVFIQFVKYHLKEKEKDYAFYGHRPEMKKMRSPKAYAARTKKLTELEKKPKEEVIEEISSHMKSKAPEFSRKFQEIFQRRRSDTYVERRKSYEKKQKDRHAKDVKEKLGLITKPSRGSKPTENYDLSELFEDEEEKYDPEKEYAGPQVPFSEKFFFPRYFVHTGALTAQVPVVPGNQSKKWLRSNLVMEGKPGTLAKEELVARKEDRGNLRSRHYKERYDNREQHFGFSKYGVPVKNLGLSQDAFNYRRIDFDRLEGPEGSKVDWTTGDFHEKKDGFPRKKWRRDSIHSDDSTDDAERRFKQKFVHDVQKSWRGVTGIRTLGDWYTPSGTKGYRPGFRKELALKGSSSSSSSEEPVPPPPPKPKPKSIEKPKPPPPPPPPPPPRKPRPRPPPPEVKDEVATLPFSSATSLPSWSSEGTTQRPKPRQNPDQTDFLFRNALRVARTPARRPPRIFVDDVKGSRHDYCTSGLAIIHVLRKDFGKIPEYLKQRNVELGRPAIPDWRKFYQPHECKYYHRHVHCKGCNRVLPVDKFGARMYMCDEQEVFGPCPCPEMDDAIYQPCYPGNSRVRKC